MSKNKNPNKIYMEVIQIQPNDAQFEQQSFVLKPENLFIEVPAPSDLEIVEGKQVLSLESAGILLQEIRDGFRGVDVVNVDNDDDEGWE